MSQAAPVRGRDPGRLLRPGRCAAARPGRGDGPAAPRVPVGPEQTHESLVRYLVEEAYETIEAIESGDRDHCDEELGDLLLQVMFHARIASRAPRCAVRHRRRRRAASSRSWSAGIPTSSATSRSSRTPRRRARTGRRSRRREGARPRPMDGIPPGSARAQPGPTRSIGRTLRSDVGPGARVPSPGETAYTAETLGEVLFALVAAARAAGLDPEQALRQRVRARWTTCERRSARPRPGAATRRNGALRSQDWRVGSASRSGVSAEGTEPSSQASLARPHVRSQCRRGAIALMPNIEAVGAREILDSRGNPTVEVEVALDDNTVARAAVPSGASTGQFEAVELRDGGDWYGGKGVGKAVAAVNDADRRRASRACRPTSSASSTRRCSTSTARPTRPSSAPTPSSASRLAVAKAAAESARLPLFRYVGGPNAYLLPVPMMNILNGGAHADSNVDIQEFMIAPIGAPTFAEALQQRRDGLPRPQGRAQDRGSRHRARRRGRLRTEPRLQPRGARPDRRRGRQGRSDARHRHRARARRRGHRVLRRVGRSTTPSRAARSPPTRWRPTTPSCIDAYPIVSIEDPMSEEDWDGWEAMTASVGDQDPDRRRRPLRHQRRAAAARDRRAGCQRAAGQGQPDREPDRDARRRRPRAPQRPALHDEPPFGRDRGHHDRRPRRRHQLRSDQDRCPGPLRARCQVQPAAPDRGRARATPPGTPEPAPSPVTGRADLVHGVPLRLQREPRPRSGSGRLVPATSATSRNGRKPTPRKTSASPRAAQPSRTSRTTRSTSRVEAPMAAAQLSSSRAKLTGRAAVLLLVVAVLAVSYASSMRAWLKQRSEINTLQRPDRRAAAGRRRAKLQKQRLHDPAYIQSLARSRFGWVLPGETGFRVIGADGKVLSDGGSQLSDPTQPAAPPKTEWWQDTYATVVSRGRPSPTPRRAARTATTTSPARRARAGRRPTGDRRARPRRRPCTARTTAARHASASLTAARAATPTSCRPRHGCRTGRRSRRSTT